MNDLFDDDDDLSRRILAVMPGGIVLVSKEGRILKANAIACKILGLSYDALTQKYTSDFETATLRDDETPMPVEEYPVSEALRTQTQQPPKIVGVRHEDGFVRWAIFTATPIHKNGALFGVAVTFMDITAVRDAEKKLRASEARFRSIFDSAPNVVISTDLEGRIEFINHIAPRTTRAEVIGKYAVDLIAPEDRDRVRACLARVLESGNIDSYEIVAPSGTRFSVNVGPIRVDGRTTGFTFIAWDISRQRDLEARLLISDRMASIGQLAAGVAHEINNPLTYVLANLYSLERALRSSSDEDVRALSERATHALEGAERIKSIVRDLSTYSHTSPTSAVLIDVRPMLESSIRMAQGQLRYRAQVVTKLGDVPPVLASDSRLGQVFLNLLVNAAQAIPEGRVEDHVVTVITRTDEKGDVVVEVHDTGTGIPPELVDKIFDPFVTTKEQGEGTGLGLYIVKSVVAALDGEIRVTSRPGHTVFTVTLKAADEVLGARSVPSAEQELPLTRKRVLLIDDEPKIRALAKEALFSHDLTLAASGREAIAALAEAAFDIVICDLVMPDLTGMDVYQHMEEHAPSELQKFVFMTGGAFTERARSFIAERGVTLLDKPFSAERLRKIVAAAGAPKK